MRFEESLNVTFDESLPEPNSSSSVEGDKINEPIVPDLNGSPSLQVNVSDEGYPKSRKEAKGHPIEQVIGELNKRTLRMMLPDNQGNSTKSVVDNKAFEDSNFNVELYLNDEEDNGDNVVVPQTPSVEVRTRIYNIKVPPL
ncbi:hypothetical protein Tco_1507370 [Tanacetum coccineum]